jgi:hypothetical protein
MPGRIVTYVHRYKPAAVRISEVTQHRSLDTVMVYVRRLDAFKSHPLEGVL